MESGLTRRLAILFGASAAFWLALGTLTGLHEHYVWTASRPLWPGLGVGVVGRWLPYALVTPPLFLLSDALVQRGASRGRAAATLGAALVLGVLVHLTLSAALQHAMAAAGYDDGEGGPPVSGLGGRIARRIVDGGPYELIPYGAALAVALALAQRRAAVRRALESERLRQQLADAQLAALKHRLQPHFLFNTLHAVGVTARTDPETANRMVALLGDLLRLTLRHRDRPVVPLREELEILAPYLELQRLRFSDRLAVAIDAPADVLDARVPDLLLQPLVENAVRHGIERRAGAGRLAVAARRDGAWLELRVTDDGAGLAGPPREGLGLGTTRARLATLYGDAHTLRLAASAGGGAEVTVRVPWSTSDGEASARDGAAP